MRGDPMKLAASVMIVFACTAVGIIKARGLTELDSTYSSLLSALELLKNEICTNMTPLCGALELAGRSSDKPVKNFLGSVGAGLPSLGSSTFSDIWSAAVKHELPMLPESCSSSLVSLGNSLGRYDADLQRLAIERCSAQIAAAQCSLRENACANKRMYVGAGASTGLIVVILML